MEDRRTEPHPDAATELGRAVHVARCIGADPELVLAGGGNTSVKTVEDGRRVLYVKGSGADLGQVREADYTPLALDPVRALVDQDLPDNGAMYAALMPHILRPDAPRPSIETLMHAGLPATHVIHTHAAAVLAIANTVDATRHLEAAFGATAPVVPYRHSGVALARACVEAWRGADPRGAEGLVLAHHGALSCGRDAQEAHERMLALAGRAESYLASHGAARPAGAATMPVALSTEDLRAIVRLRAAACRVAGRRLVGTVRSGGFIGTFARRPDLATLTAHGPSTPGHAIWTKRLPQVGRDVDAYAAAYRTYLQGAAQVDCAPRIILDHDFGLLAFGVTRRHADMATQVFMHDAVIMARACRMGGYATIGADLMRAAEIEYAGFESRVARDYPRAGEVHVFDRACDHADAIAALLDQGAAVAAIDAGPDVVGLFSHPAYLGLVAPLPDVAVPAAIVAAFGGLDHLHVAAGWRRHLQPLALPPDD